MIYKYIKETIILYTIEMIEILYILKNEITRPLLINYLHSVPP